MVVAVATDTVNRGEKLPLDTLVTVPLPPVALIVVPVKESPVPKNTSDKTPFKSTPTRFAGLVVVRSFISTSPFTEKVRPGAVVCIPTLSFVPSMCSRVESVLSPMNRRKAFRFIFLSKENSPSLLFM